MGLIFKDAKDDQNEAMYEQIHLGNTLQWRYDRIRWTITTTILCTVSATSVALADYAVFKFTEYSGIIGWILG